MALRGTLLASTAPREVLMFYVLAFVIAGLGLVYLRKRRARKTSARA